MSDKYCVLQDDLKDCGVCSLLSIIKYYHGDASKEYLRELTRTSKDGVNALNLLKGARELGFEAYGLKGKIKDLADSNIPLIAHVTLEKRFNHFIVIYKIDRKKNRFLVMDPARGYIYISFSNFINISTGYFLILKPKQLIPKLVEENNFYDSVKKVYKNNKYACVIIIILSLIYTLISTIDSYQLKLFLDENLNDDITRILFILIYFIIIKLVINLFRSRLINMINYLVEKEIICKAYHHIINLPYLYYKNHTNGDLITRINDLGNIKELISNLFVTIFVDIIFAIIILIVMLRINGLLSLIIITCLFLYIIISLINNYFLNKKIKDNIMKSSILNNTLVESLASFQTIKNLSLQKYIQKKFENNYFDYSNSRINILSRINNEVFFKNLVCYLGNLLVIYEGVILINNHEISISFLITFITLSNYLIEPIKKILDLEVLYLNAKESIRRMKEIYNIPTENLEIDKHKNIKSLKGNVNVDNLSYSYNGINDVIKNFSLEMEEGQKILLYGKSGCGKSTLMKLLIKYLNNDYKGNITIDGFDLKEIDISILRKNICYVSQQEYLFTDTVYENIVLGRKISYSKFLEHAKNLYIDEIVSKSILGYNYMLENNGENISGGEKMRIIIARSIIYNYNIYIYDEVFSEIDITKERQILNYLFNLLPNKTFIIINHRDSNLDLYDKRIMLGECNE